MVSMPATGEVVERVDSAQVAEFLAEPIVLFVVRGPQSGV